MKDKRISTNGINLQIRAYEQEGDAIIFLHFSGVNLMMWERAVPYFQDRYHVILVDLRGHGKSERPETGYHMDEMARDVVGIMQELNVERAHIVGSSLGAEVGLSLATHYPDQVLSLILDGALHSEYGPYGTWEGSEAEFEAHVANQLENIRNAPETFFPSIEALVDNRRELYETYGWWNPYLEAVVRYGAYEVEEGKYISGMGKRAKEAYMEHYFHYRFEDYYPKVMCPLLMLAEKESEDEREKAAMEGLRALAKQGKIVDVEGWAHPYCWLLAPDNAIKAILRFFES